MLNEKCVCNLKCCWYTISLRIYFFWGNGYPGDHITDFCCISSLFRPIQTLIVCMEQSRTALWLPDQASAYRRPHFLPCVGIAIKIVKEEPGMKGIATFRPSFGRSCKALSFSSFITSLAVKRTKNLPL